MRIAPAIIVRAERDKTIDEVKDMLPQKPERMESVEEPKKSELVKASYDVIGCILEVYKQLGVWTT